VIADRLGQVEANRADTFRLEQARLLFRMAKTLDMDNVIKRVLAEGSDPGLLGVRS
jgi:hypothetical protein